MRGAYLHYLKTGVSALLLLVTSQAQYLRNISGRELLVEKGGTHVVLDGDTEVIYQLPSNGKPLSGLLFVAHGCGHSANDWFPKSDNCLTCTGLPIEVTIVKEALSRNIAVVAVSSNNRQHKCWIQKSDRLPVINAIKHVYAVANVSVETSPIPLYLFGASSGGSFVGTFAQDAKTGGIPVSALCVQIIYIKIHRFDESLTPILFVHMPLESHTKKMIGTVIEEINRHTPNSASEKLCSRKVLVPTYFNDHGAALTVKESATLVAALVAGGYLTASKMLIEDPRESHWREVRTNYPPMILISIMVVLFLFLFLLILALIKIMISSELDDQWITAIQ